MRIKSGLPKGCGWNLDRENGKMRIRFRDRKTGFSTYIYAIPGTEAFAQQYALALEGSRAKAMTIVGEKRTVAGTVNALIVSYYASPGLKGLKPSTQSVRRNMLERFRERYGDLPVRGLTRQVLDKLMGDRSNTPMAANNLMKVLRYLLDHAIALNMIASNPATGIRKYRNTSEGHPSWSEEGIAQYRARHPLDTRAGLALALLVYTGQRRGDVVKMGRQHVTGDLIAVRQEKTDIPLLIPMHPELMQTLDALPKTNMTFLVTERGAPFSAAGFGNWFRERCDEAGLPQYSAHGLRHAAATRFANIGCTDEEIMAFTGHRSRASLAVYTRGADQLRLARRALAKLTNSEQEMVQHPIPLDQNWRK